MISQKDTAKRIRQMQFIRNPRDSDQDEYNNGMFSKQYYTERTFDKSKEKILAFFPSIKEDVKIKPARFLLAKKWKFMETYSLHEKRCCYLVFSPQCRLAFQTTELEMPKKEKDRINEQIMTGIDN